MFGRTSFIRDAKGATAVEFSILAVPIILLIAGAIQVFILILTQQMIETTAEAIGRQILTGKVQQQGLSKKQFADLACSLLPTTLNCAKLIVDVKVASSFNNASTAKPDLSSIGDPTQTTVLTYQPGTAHDIVVVRVLYALTVITMPGLDLQSSSSAFGFNFPMATSVFKTESYS